MNPTSLHPLSNRVRRFGLALLLLAVPACGLSDYEARMREAQEREERFREEQKYLDVAVQIPKRKNKDGKDEPVANLFFRPPKGILPKPEAQARNGLSAWRYSRGKGGSDFVYVELAFPEDAANFANTVVSNYTSSDQATHRRQSITPPEQEKPLLFDIWESNSGQAGYSINVLQGSRKPLAVIYHYSKGRSQDVRKAIELSLQSLGVDKEASAARLRYNQKSPWKLQLEPSESE